MMTRIALLWIGEWLWIANAASDTFIQTMKMLLSKLPLNSGIVDLQPLFFRFTLDVTTAFLFGESIHSLTSTDNSQEQEFATAFDLAQKYVIKRFRLQDLYWLIGGSKFRDACRKVHAFADQVIDQNLSAYTSIDNTNDTRYVFLKSVAKACPDRKALRGQIINILAAGRDTTACLLSWTL
jgi:cytochrome P450